MSAIDIIQHTTQHVFITGKAGTGKSTLLEYIRLHITKKMVVLAPTGVAALHVHGDTIHSFFGLKPGFELDEARQKRVSPAKAKQFQSLQVILIDEISMVRADLLDAIDIFLRKARDCNDAFGGVQMVFIGDLYQLPPVLTPSDAEKFLAEYAVPYFFAAKVFLGAADLFSTAFELHCVELQTIYRQTDALFISLLNAVRTNTITDDELALLNMRCDTLFVPNTEDTYIHLVTTNADAQSINTAALHTLSTEKYIFTAALQGDIPKNLYPNDTVLTMSVGAQVIFIYNDPERRWVNGTIGIIVDIQEEYSDVLTDIIPYVRVKIPSGAIVDVRMYTWEISRYVFKSGVFVREQIGTFTQLPLKLAWAITIHKSQGKTFERVILDLGRGSFVHGQSYVALSRCTSLDGLILRRPIRRSDIIMDKRIEKFGERIVFEKKDI